MRSEQAQALIRLGRWALWVNRKARGLLELPLQTSTTSPTSTTSVLSVTAGLHGQHMVQDCNLPQPLITPFPEQVEFPFDNQVKNYRIRFENSIYWL